MIFIGGKVRPVLLFGAGIERHALQIKFRSAASQTVDIAVRRQIERHAAERNVVRAGLGVLCKRAVGVASGGEAGVEHLVALRQNALARVIVRRPLRAGVCKVTVEEDVLQLAA